MNIGFVGLGKLGLPVSVAIAEKGHVVRGYDASAETLARYQTGVTGLYEPGLDERMAAVRAKRQLRFCSLAEVVAGSEIIFVAVQTPHPPELDGSVRFNHARLDFDYSYLVRSCEEIARELLHCHEHKTVVIVSTVLPGTTKQRVYQAMSAICDDENWTLLYNPSFIAMGTVLKDYVNPEFSLIGVNRGSADPLVSFYRSIHKSPCLVMSWEEAELTKVTYNTFIGLKIVYANTVMQMCHEVGADCDVVLGALKQAKDRLISPKYLAGGMGDGGACHCRDNIAMANLSERCGLNYNLFDALMTIREDQTEWLVDQMCQYDMPKLILGKVFKAHTNLVVGSPAILAGNILREMGFEATYWDPEVAPAWPALDGPAVALVATCWPEVKDAVNRLPAGSVVIDPWGFIESVPDGVELIRVGRRPLPVLEVSRA